MGFFSRKKTIREFFGDAITKGDISTTTLDQQKVKAAASAAAALGISIIAKVSDTAENITRAQAKETFRHGRSRHWE